ncbi:MAG: EF-hand domain-containing protein [Wenzhouxiangella sp.]
MDRTELAEKLFDEFDKNRDGVLSRGEFKELVECLFGRYGHQTSSEIFTQFDADHDNRISKDELIDLLIEYQL